MHVKRTAGAEQTQETGDDQIDRDDEIEQSRDDQYQNAGDEGDDRSDAEAQVQIHGRFLLVFAFAAADYWNNFRAFCNVFMTPHKSGTVTESHKTMKRAFMTSNLYGAGFSGG
jgi:hypothetical protein